LFFAGTIGGEMFAFDLGKPTDLKSHEYAVFLFERGLKLKRIAEDFRAFVVDYCLAQDLGTEGESKMEFLRY
jgi:hypothetical protein